jgi:hypothetical protein
MEKVYCKECRHVSKIDVGYAGTPEHHCFHDVCFENIDKDTPFSKGRDYRGECTSRRVSDFHQLNESNNCEYFELRVNIFKRIANSIKECFA